MPAIHLTGRDVSVAEARYSVARRSFAIPIAGCHWRRRRVANRGSATGACSDGS